MRLLLAKKRGSPRRFHSRAKLKRSRDHHDSRSDSTMVASHTATIFSVLFGIKTLLLGGRARSLLASTSLSFISQLLNLSSLSLPSPSKMTRIEMIYAPLVRLPLCFKFMYSDGEKIFTYQGWRRSRSKVSTKFLQSSIHIFLHLPILHWIFYLFCNFYSFCTRDILIYNCERNLLATNHDRIKIIFYKNYYKKLLKIKRYLIVPISLKNTHTANNKDLYIFVYSFSYFCLANLFQNRLRVFNKLSSLYIILQLLQRSWL